jgi:hypothetical protein
MQSIDVNPERTSFLAPLIGAPWSWQSRNCWDFACHVERKLFGRELPGVAVPAEASKRWIFQAIDKHDEHMAWPQTTPQHMSPCTAVDGISRDN